jgi:hypothetical protein
MGAIHLDAGFDYSSAYVFRGIRQPENSPVIEGNIGLHLTMIDHENFKLGSYFTVHGNGGEKSGGPFTFYQDDWSAGVETVCHQYHFQLGFNEWHSPDGSFGTVDEVMARLEIQDADWMKALGCPIDLHPHLMIARETKDQNAVVSPRSQPGKLNTYVEVGIRPETSFDVELGRKWHVNLAVPVDVGMSWDNYYSLTPTAGSNWFGFLTVGADLGIPLPVPASWGNWQLHGMINYLHDGAAGAVQVNKGHHDFMYGGFGVTVKY